MKNRKRHEISKRWRKTAVCTLLALLIFIIPIINVSGFSSYNNKLPDNGDSFSCSTCHTGTKLNEFGVDFKDNNNKYDDSLAARDSDCDGYTNEEEFDSNPPTNPGDELSNPGSNTSANNTTAIVNPDTSAYLGPIDMKDAVALFYALVIPIAVGIFIGLIIAEASFLARRRWKAKKQ